MLLFEGVLFATKSTKITKGKDKVGMNIYFDSFFVSFVLLRGNKN